MFLQNNEKVRLSGGMLKFKHPSQEPGLGGSPYSLAGHSLWEESSLGAPLCTGLARLLPRGVPGHVYVVQAKEKQRNAFLSVAQNINLSQEPSKDNLAKE